jgi:two-component SAPR family response regulator
MALKTANQFKDDISILTAENMRYFDSIFSKISAPGGEYLMKTALLPYLDANHAQALVRTPSACRMIEAMESVGDSFEAIYRKKDPHEYQPLLQKYLTVRANRSFTKEEADNFLFRAAALFESSGDVISAADMLINTQNGDALIDFLSRNARDLTANNDSDVTKRILDALPLSLKSKDYPWPNYWMGIQKLTSDPGKSRIYLTHAYDNFLESEDIDGILFSWVGIVASILLECRTFTEIPFWIEQLNRRLKEGLAFPTEISETRVTATMITALILTSRDQSQINHWIERANAILSREPASIDKILLLAILTTGHMVKGETSRAEYYKDLLVDQLKANHLDPTNRIISELVVAVFLRMTANHKACGMKIDECLKLAKKTGVRRLDVLLLEQKAANAMSSGELGEAEKQLKKMASVIDLKKPIEACLFYFLKSRSLYLQKNYRDAMYHGERALKLCIDSRLSFFEGVQHISYSQILIGAGNLDKAGYYLREAEKNNSRVKSRLLDYYLTITNAHLAFRQGDEINCFSLLKKALTMVGKDEYYCSPLDSSHLHTLVFEKALQKGFQVEYVQDEIRKKKIVPSDTAMLLENWPWNLKIYTMGRFSILEDGKPIHSRKKAQRKPMDLLKVLIALGGRQVSQDLIIDYLWPDAEGDVSRKSFATTLHRLRKKIGTPDALQLSNGCLTLSQKHCWVDVWAFERIVNNIDKLWEKSGDEKAILQAIQFSNKAIDLYKGPFLFEQLNEPWTIFYRERVRNKFLRLVGKLGRYWEKNGELNKALECFQKSLEVDGFDEETYRRLMVCYKRMGLNSKALEVYNRCKNIMTAKFGVGLSQATEIVRASIHG